MDEETDELEQGYDEVEERKIVATQTPCDEDMNYCQTTLCDLRSLVVNKRETIARVTIGGQQLVLLPVHLEEDIVFDCTPEGNHRGYAALLSPTTKEIFLWHVVEMARKDHDGNVMFPEKVQIPTLSLESLVRISKRCTAFDGRKNRWFLCSYPLTRKRVSRRLFNKAVEALRGPHTSEGTKKNIVPVPPEYFKETTKDERYLNLSLFAVRKGGCREAHDRVEARKERRKRDRTRKGKEVSLPNKRKVYVFR